MQGIQVALPDAAGGFVEARGFLRLEETGLVLEYQSRDGVFGVIRSPVKRMLIPIAELDSVRLRAGLFRTRLVLQSRNLQTFEGIHGAWQGELKLKLRRRDRKEARRLILHVSGLIADCTLARLEEDRFQLGLLEEAQEERTDEPLGA